jgi:hypothetical protein
VATTITTIITTISHTIALIDRTLSSVAARSTWIRASTRPSHSGRIRSAPVGSRMTANRSFSQNKRSAHATLPTLRVRLAEAIRGRSPPTLLRQYGWPGAASLPRQPRWRSPNSARQSKGHCGQPAPAGVSDSASLSTQFEELFVSQGRPKLLIRVRLSSSSVS